ncbi:MAG: hypothetical protein COB53_03445 [Elusimicrobia bacterium]|nr:MAG: hypothetical protein COB53_03445 [Elusimicrobiota bacterium]
MKKPFLTILAVLVVIDVIAMTAWYKHKQKTEEKAVATAAAITAEGPPPETAPVEPAYTSETPQASGGFGSALYGPGISPGGCASLNACEEYCLQEKNEAECIAWTQEDQKKVRDEREQQQETMEPSAGMMPLPGPMIGDIEITPGDCTGKACERYCAIKANRDECIDYCSNPKNKKTCSKWKGLSRSIKDAVGGSLISEAAVIDENSFSVLRDER